MSRPSAAPADAADRRIHSVFSLGLLRLELVPFARATSGPWLDAARAAYRASSLAPSRLDGPTLLGLRRPPDASRRIVDRREAVRPPLRRVHVGSARTA